MKAFFHSFRTTARRYRWEIIAFITLSAAISLLMGRDPLELALDPFSSPDLKSLARLETIAGLWIILRLMISKPLALTEGGWQTRPVPRLAAMGAPAALLTVTLLPPLLLRLSRVQFSAQPNLGQRLAIFTNWIIPGLFSIFVVAMLLRIAANLSPRRPGARRRLPFTLVGLAAFLLWFHLPIGAFFGGKERHYWPQPDLNRQPSFAEGIRRLLPKDARTIGDWDYPAGWSPQMKELLRISLVPPRIANQPGLKIEVVPSGSPGRVFRIEVRCSGVDEERLDELSGSTIVLHDSTGGYTLARFLSFNEGRSHLPFDPRLFFRREIEFDLSRDAKTSGFTWEQLLSKAEIIFYYPDRTIPQFKVEATGPNQKQEPAPPLARRPAADKAPAGVTGIFTLIDFGPLDQAPPSWQELSKDLTPGAMPEIVKHYPWSDRAWDTFVKPFLLAHATDPDKAALLERMATEPRLGEIFVAKGWKKDALPLLKHFAKQRLPLDSNSLTALLEEKDPGLTTDLAAIAARFDGEVEKLEPLLQNQPGLDWRSFVHDGWIYNKYSFRSPASLYPWDLWAARLGDLSAFRHIAERAARRETGYPERLRNLVTGEPVDVLAFVRENLTKLKFDPASGRWGL